MATPIKTTANYLGYLISSTYAESDYSDTPNILTETWVIVYAGTRYSQVQMETHSESLHSEGLLPSYGMVWNDWKAGRSPAIAGSAVHWTYSAVCISYEATSNKDGSLSVVVNFSNRKKTLPTRQDDAGAPTAPANASVYPVVVESTAGSREMELFRSTPAGAPPATLDSSTADIVGTAVASGAKQGPVVTVPTLRLRVRRAVNVQENGNIAVIIKAFSGMVGARNTTTFMTFTAGEVYCESFNTAKLEGPNYELVFDFVWDAYYEHSQVPVHDVDGVPKMNSTGTDFLDVRWKRVGRPNFEFNTIFFINGAYTVVNTEYQGIGERGYW